MQQTSKASSQQAAHTAKVMSLCLQAPAQRSMDDIWFIRDRLHERSNFFSPLALSAAAADMPAGAPMHWVQNEVASQASKPSDVCLILEGKAAVAVRSSPGTSLLKDVAMLQPGDTFGEIALLGAQRNPAFVVVRSKELLALAVDAHALAQAMVHQRQQAQAPADASKPPSLLASTNGQQQQAKQQHTWTPEDAPMNVDALYKLIEQVRRPAITTLSSEQQQQVAKVQQVQLQAAADAEALTVGSWMTLPHQLNTAQHFRSKPPAGESTCTVQQPPIVRQQQHQALVPGHGLAILKTTASLRQSSSTTGSQLSTQETAMTGTAGATGPASEAMAADEATNCLVTGTSQQGIDMYRARHSAILQMAVLKASSSQ